MHRFLLLSVLIFSSAGAAFAQFRLYEQGLEAYKKNKFEETINLLNEYLDKPTRDKKIDVDVRYYLALSYFKTNSFTSAVREFDEAIKLGHPNVFNIRWFMAKAYSSLRLPREAVDEYNLAVGLEGTATKESRAKLHIDRGEEYLKWGKPDLAAEDARTAMTLDPSNGNGSSLLSRASSASQGSPGVVLAKKPAEAMERSASENKQETKQESKKQTTAESQSKVQPDKKAQDVPPVIPQTAPVQTEKTPSASSDLDEEEIAYLQMYKDEQRFALVIGNSSYKHVPPLKNAINDASDMAAMLEKANFKVIKVIDGTYEQIRDAFKKFHANLSNGPRDKTVGLFYYAGHGLQSEGENYIVPVEANIQFEDDIPRTCLPIQRVVLTNMERSNSRMNIVILDACRNNPFPAASRSAGGGLTEMKKAKGSFIAYATSPGSTASDGNGRNGLYTQELLKALAKNGRTIEQVFKEVRQNVLRLSNGTQNTWDSSNIIGEFYFRIQ